MATTDEQRTTRHLQQALAILDKMDDDITSCGGDDDEHGRRELAKIRRVKDHLRKAAPPTASLRMHRNPNAKAAPDEVRWSRTCRKETQLPDLRTGLLGPTYTCTGLASVGSATSSPATTT